MKRQPFHHRFQDMDALPRRSFTSGKKWDPNHWFFEFHVSHEKKTQILSIACLTEILIIWLIKIPT